MLVPVLQGPEPLLLLLVALAVDAGLGGWAPADRVRVLPWRPLHALAREIDRRLDRLQRSEATRRARGYLAAGVMVLLALVAGWVLATLAARVPQMRVIELWMLAGAVALRAPWLRVRAVGAALAIRDRDRAHDAVRVLAPGAPGDLDDHAMVRTAVEALPVVLHRRLVAPALWYLLGGLPGLVLWRTAEVMEASFGLRTDRHRGFGAGAAGLMRLMDYVPARLTALTAVLASPFVATASPRAALRTAWRDGAKPSLAAGSAWPVAAFAGALGLALAGPRREGEVVVRAPWIGDGRARAEPGDLRRALLLFVVAGLVTAALLGGAALAARAGLRGWPQELAWGI